MPGRRITGEIEWAVRAERPAPFGAQGSRGAKLKGLQYERAVAGALPLGWLHGQWFKFCDENGVGYCQPDFLRITASVVFALECKLTDVMEAKAQLLGLYLPVLQFVFQRPARGVIVARNLTPESTNVVDSLSNAMERVGTLPTLHWPWPQKLVGKRGPIWGINVGPAKATSP